MKLLLINKYFFGAKPTLDVDWCNNVSQKNSGQQVCCFVCNAISLRGFHLYKLIFGDKFHVIGLIFIWCGLWTTLIKILMIRSLPFLFMVYCQLVVKMFDYIFKNLSIINPPFYFGLFRYLCVSFVPSKFPFFFFNGMEIVFVS